MKFGNLATIFTVHRGVAGLLNKSDFCGVEGSAHNSPDNIGIIVAKQKFRITNWRTYNKAPYQLGGITFWRYDEVGSGQV